MPAIAEPERYVMDVEGPAHRVSEVALATGAMPLPALKGSIFALNHFLNRSPIDLDEIARTVRLDVGLTAQVLRLAYGDITSDEEPEPRLEHCLVLLGIRTLRSQVLTAPVMESVVPASRLAQAEMLWQHSHISASIAQRVCEQTGHIDTETAYLAGLLHDIGKVPWLMAPDAGDRRVTEHHTLLGSRWAARWRLPLFFIDAIENHHHPDNAKHDPSLVAVVAAANSIAHLWGFAFTTEPLRASDPAALLDVVRQYLPQLNPQQTSRVVEHLATAYANWLQLLPSAPALSAPSAEAHRVKEEVS